MIFGFLHILNNTGFNRIAFEVSQTVKILVFYFSQGPSIADNVKM
jgi:hypothetical protein